MDTLEGARLARHFERIGAQLKIETVENTNGRRGGKPEPFSLDVAESRQGSRHESYILRIRPDVYPALDLTVLDVQPKMRHLLLLSRPMEGIAEASTNSRFLCGHDERHWFVAAVKTGTLVHEAMESLKPAGIARMQHQLNIAGRDWNRRKNAAFQRQGEWFFVPSTVEPPALLILKNEAIRRSNEGKPHLVEFLYRDGGEVVYVCAQRPQGVSVRQYEKLLADRPEAKSWGWRSMRRNMQVLAKGKVRHADHATITLNGWHRVIMSGEILSNRVAFLD